MEKIILLVWKDLKTGDEVIKAFKELISASNEMDRIMDAARKKYKRYNEMTLREITLGAETLELVPCSIQ